MKNWFSVGFIFMYKPKLEWKRGRHLLILEGDEPGITKENKEFKNNIGVSMEYSHFLLQGIFASAGIDMWKESEAQSDKKASVMPMNLFLKAGLFQPFMGNEGFARMFAGIGLGKTGYKYDFVGVSFDESIGLTYQFGGGIIFRNFFVDLAYKSILTDYQEEGDIPMDNELTSYRKNGGINFENIVLQVGIFF